MIPRGSFAATWSAARPTQGAVFRAQGSTMKFSFGSVGTSRRAAAACFGPHTTKVSLGRASGGRRPTVAASSGASPASARNCLGRLLRESGQNRVPEPPAMITG